MDVAEALSRAWKAVETAKIPGTLHEVAFKEALRLVLEEGEPGTDKPPGSSGGRSGRRQAAKRPAAAGAQQKQGEQESTSPAVSSEAFFSRLADETGVDVDKLERVFHVDGGAPRLNVTARRLGTTLKDRMVNVATLMSVARHAGLGEAETPLTIVRQECTRLNSVDKNFSTYVSDISGILYTGPRTAKVLRVRPQGVTTFSVAVDRVLGESSAGEDQA
jgi:hypothetical protein